MGHGDKIVIADVNFPPAAKARKLIRVDGIGATEMPDQYDDNNFLLMQKCDGDNADTSLWVKYKAI